MTFQQTLLKHRLVKPISFTLLFAAQVHYNAYANDLQTANNAESAQPSITKIEKLLNEMEFRNTTYYQHYQNKFGYSDTLLGLHEGRYYGENSEFDYGISADYSDQKIDPDKVLDLKHIAYTALGDNYDFKIGKFVSRIGTMDYLSNINHMNSLNYNFYDDSNLNMRYLPTWMVRANYYPTEDTTASLFVKPIDKDGYSIDDSMYQYGLDIGIPFALVNTGNEDLNLIGEKVLLPVYQENGKAALSDYLSNHWPSVDKSADNSEVGVNFQKTLDNFIIGFSGFSGVSKVPLIKIDQDLIDDMAELETTQEKQDYLENYLADENNDPISNVEFERFHQVATYFETSINQYGVRGEITYRNKIPLLNRTTDQVTLGLGTDYKNGFYTNLEAQYSVYPEADIDAYAAFWLFQFEPWRKDNWEFTLQNVVTAIWIQNESGVADLIKLSASRGNLEIALQFLGHNQQQYSPNTAALLLKVTF